MSGIACFLFDLKGVLYVIENIIHFKKSTKSWPELKIYLIWSICIKKLNKVFSDKITSAGSLHFFTFQLSHCQFAIIFFISNQTAGYIFFSEITHTHPPPPSRPRSKVKWSAT